MDPDDQVFAINAMQLFGYIGSGGAIGAAEAGKVLQQHPPESCAIANTSAIVHRAGDGIIGFLNDVAARRADRQ
ncbi:MAG: hypothetical protein IPG74_19480 [Flavobacteriales bacterium]|nr:hypothetical protein [Flavobacteriales bacterium]